MKIALFGKGKMGKLVEQLALEANHTVTDVASADVCIDFSHKDAVLKHVHTSIHHSTPIVIGTTGWETDLDKVKKAIEKSETAALYAPNFSLGMAYFMQLLKLARSLLSNYDCAGVEYHHNQKKDAPSGTAISIANLLEMTTPFTSVRCGRITGRHEVLFDSPFDTITLTHEAHSRDGFAKGSLEAAQWIQNKQGWFTLDDMLRTHFSTDHSL